MKRYRIVWQRPNEADLQTCSKLPASVLIRRLGSFTKNWGPLMIHRVEEKVEGTSDARHRSHL